MVGMAFSYGDLKGYAFKRRLRRKDMIILDYVQDKLLYFLSLVHDLGFSLKGGTALYKVYNSGRFSRDIDIDSNVGVEVNRIIELFSTEGFLVRILRRRQTENILFLTIRVSRRDIDTEITVDISSREPSGDVVDFYSPYPDIPPFKIRVSSLSSILMDKLDAIIRRKKPRDLYDVYIITKKYDVSMSFDRCRELRRAINSIKPLWNSLRELVLFPLPKFEDVRNFVLRKVRC